MFETSRDLEKIAVLLSPRKLLWQRGSGVSRTGSRIPWGVAMQRSIVGMALDLLERAWMPRTTIQTPFRWDNDAWRENFMRVDESNREALAREGNVRRQFQADMKKGR